MLEQGCNPEPDEVDLKAPQRVTPKKLYEFDLEHHKKEDIINLWLKANYLFYDKKYFEAMDVYEKIISQDPKNSYAHYFIAYAYCEVNCFIIAQYWIEEAIKLKKDPKFIALKERIEKSIAPANDSETDKQEKPNQVFEDVRSNTESSERYIPKETPVASSCTYNPGFFGKQVSSDRSSSPTIVIEEVIAGSEEDGGCEQELLRANQS